MMKSKNMTLNGKYSTAVGGKIIATEKLDIKAGFVLNGTTFTKDCSFDNAEITVTSPNTFEVKSGGELVDVSDFVQ